MKLFDLIETNLGYAGRMVGGSKSRYKKANPNSIVYFNACIFDKDLKQIWWGDIDITKDKEALDKIAKESQQIFYVTPEHPFRTDFNTITKKLIDSNEYVIKYNIEVIQ